jgi:hypothetical protein
MKKSTRFLIASIFLLIALNVVSNYMEEAQVDSARLPEKVETSKGFQRWLTNHKKRMDVSADDFTLKDKNEVYNATFLEVSRLETQEEITEHLAFVETFRQFDDVTISPNDRQLLDYRHEKRDGYEPTEVHYYGLREDKLIDTKILSCMQAANCYFDRAYFLDNNTFVISEISRNDITKADVESETWEKCAIDEICTYTFKLHLIDLINNARYVYETTPFEKILADMIQFF